MILMAVIYVVIHLHLCSCSLGRYQIKSIRFTDNYRLNMSQPMNITSGCWTQLWEWRIYGWSMIIQWSFSYQEWWLSIAIVVEPDGKGCLPTFNPILGLYPSISPLFLGIEQTPPTSGFSANLQGGSFLVDISMYIGNGVSMEFWCMFNGNSILLCSSCGRLISLVHMVAGENSLLVKMSRPLCLFLKRKSW